MPLRAFRYVFVLLALVCLSSVANAKIVSAKGMATVSYSEWSPGASGRQAALTKAKANALQRYIADSNDAMSRMFEAREAQFTANINNYILDATVLSQQQDKAAKTYTVVVRADIDADRLMNDLGSGAASASDVAANAHQTITFLFVARQQASVQNFDAKVYQRTDTHNGMNHNTDEGESIHAHNIGTSASENRDTVATTTTGGSVTRKADRVEWQLANTDQIDTIVTGVFSNAGYDVVDASQVQGASNGLLNVSAIQQAYSHGNDLPPTLQVDATRGVQQAGVRYLALGTLDIGMPGTDPVSGNQRDYVTVTAKLYDVSGRFARTVASIGPVQFAGLGPDPSVAQTNALQQAAKQVAQQMVDQLNNKGIH
jgi:hypothetical protein